MGTYSEHTSLQTQEKEQFPPDAGFPEQSCSKTRGKPHGEIVADHYDELALRYSSMYAGKTPRSHYYHARMDCVDQLLDHVPRGALLEIGCATGRAAERFTSRGFRYQGIDISPGMIAECRRKFAQVPAVSFDVGDASSLQFPDGSFDVVVCLGALEYVQDEQVAVHEMSRVLKQGGYLILAGNNGRSPYNLWARAVFRRITGQYPVAILREFHVESDFARILAVEDMTVVDSVYFDLALLLPPLDDSFPRAALYCSERLGRLGRGRLRKLGRGFLVKATKQAVGK